MRVQLTTNLPGIPAGMTGTITNRTFDLITVWLDHGREVIVTDADVKPCRVMVTLHAAGCLPDAEPAYFATLPEAWDYVGGELEYIYYEEEDYYAARHDLSRVDSSQPGILPLSAGYQFSVELLEA
jgi:hypothetical protein